MADYQIVLRHDTAASWVTKNPLLLLGEVGGETDTGKLKLGDGSQYWNSLPYVGSGNGIQRSVIPISYVSAITPALPTTGDVVYKVGTLTGNITISNPTGVPLDEQAMQFTFSQDATGNHQISWGSAFLFGTDITTSLIPTAPNAKWRMLFVYDAQVSKWKSVAIARGF